jgi:aryl-alcohol dehydrogenase-like predicted oxidoreductase
MTNLILGTATFNNKYGISNADKVQGRRQIREIIITAQRLGINEFDTAPAYGNAEYFLGRFLSKEIEAKVSSKISIDNSTSVNLILNSVKKSLMKTKTKKLKNLFLHAPEVLFSAKAKETINGLKEALALDLTERIGASVYSLDTLLRVKEIFPELNTFQVPENICDQRMLNSKHILDLSEENNTFIVRSIFLQGLLLMPLSDIPKYLVKSKNSLLHLDAFSKSLDVSRLDLCLAYGKAIPWASGLIVGAASPSQLQEIIKSNIGLPKEWYTKIYTLPDGILDPRRWAM